MAYHTRATLYFQNLTSVSMGFYLMTWMGMECCTVFIHSLQSGSKNTNVEIRLVVESLFYNKGVP